MESKYGGLLTEEDARHLVAAAYELGLLAAKGGAVSGDGGPEPSVADALAHSGITLTFPEDEPLFLLRGQDWAVMPALGAYLGSCARSDAPASHLAAVETAIRAFDTWQLANAERVKVPD